MTKRKVPEFEFKPSTSSEFSYGKIHRPRSNVIRELILEHNFQETEHVTVSTYTLISIQKQNCKLNLYEPYCV